MNKYKEGWIKVEMLVSHKLPNDNRKHLKRDRAYTVDPITANYLLGCHYARLSN